MVDNTSNPGDMKSRWSFDFDWLSVPMGRAAPARQAMSLALAFGYWPANPTSHRAWNILLAASLLLFALPVMAVIAVAVLVTSGRPVLYRGERLGLHRETFHIYKFRSLAADAEKRLGATVLPAESDLVTGVGKFLRTSRLDELPQLFNVLRGDMNIFGPRPVRAAIARQQEQVIDGYERRFAVRPGLLGHTQVFMPHGTSKRIRARYNNLLVGRETSALRELVFVIVAAVFCLVHVVRIVAAAIRQRLGLRKEVTHSQERIEGLELDLGDNRLVPVQVCSITPSGLVFSSRTPLPQGEMSATLTLKKLNRGRASVPIRVTQIVPAVVTLNASGNELFQAHYAAESEFGRYLIERHVLGLIFGIG